jgi:phosphomevalonate kinase
VIRALAPGKVVLWGEYAVLAGAPALVMAVDRYAQCTLSGGTETWQCSALGHQAPTVNVSRDQLLGSTPPASGSVHRLLWQVLQYLPSEELPAGGHATFDTSGLHQNGAKLGLGSSAALCVAVHAAVCRLLQQPVRYADVLRVHEALQGSGGSGIDVAAAWHGGTLRYQRPVSAADASEASPWALPAELRTVFVWSGSVARTTDHLARLQCWRDNGTEEELVSLAALSAALFSSADIIAALENYVTALMALDAAAGLEIFSAPHQRLAALAQDAGVVYKPCGAGGGDIGAAFTMDVHAAERFVHSAADEGFLPLKLETASHGLEVTG